MMENLQVYCERFGGTRLQIEAGLRRSAVVDGTEAVARHCSWVSKLQSPIGLS